MFASLYPKDVLGVVLVDSAHPAEFKRFVVDNAHKLNMIENTIPFGLPRLMGWCGSFPPDSRSMARAVGCQVGPFREAREESAHYREDGEQVRTAAPLGSKPLVVVSRDPETLGMTGLPTNVERDFNKNHEAMQEELTSLSSDSYRIIAKGSGHYVQVERPDVVVEAVRDVVDQCKGQTGPQRRIPLRIAQQNPPLLPTGSPN
jgi:pimeloyl-ACP methyl ester carboxylesterase